MNNPTTHIEAPRSRRGRTADEVAALETFEVMGTGERADFERVIHPRMVNHEAGKDEPPASRVPHGPTAAYATALWLRDAFAELRWEIHEVVSERDLVVVHCTMSGRHVRPFVAYDAAGEVDEVFPPTHRRFASTQTHWIRMDGSRMIEHWANRDDLGTAQQLGWVPPSPVYLIRMALAKRAARRAERAGATPWARGEPRDP